MRCVSSLRVAAKARAATTSETDGLLIGVEDEDRLREATDNPVPASTNHDQEAETVLTEHDKGIRLAAVSAHDAGTHAAAAPAMTGSVFEASPAATADKSV